jgi:hypothetical protein
MDSIETQKGQSMKIGSIVKALDFPGTTGHYMVGKVVSISDMESTIRCEVIKVVVSGQVKKTKNPDFFVTPLQGFHFLDASFPGRLTILD